MNLYKEKYLNYKKKYLLLKNQLGGNNITLKDIYIETNELIMSDGTKKILYFILQKLNKKFIDDVTKFIFEVLYKIRVDNDDAYNIGIQSFHESLLLNNKIESDIYIAYVVRENPINKLNNEEYYSLMYETEMLVPVFFNNNSPISSHAGIFRNKLYVDYKSNPSKDLSIKLHAFAAKATLMVNNNIKYMVTKPVPIMTNIILQYYIKNDLSNYIWIGSKSERIKYRKTVTEKEYLKNEIIKYTLINSTEIS